MNIIEAVQEACKEPTLLKALSWIAVWESERVVKVVRATKGPWDTCFYICFKMVTEEWVKQGKL
jgi:ABC-type nitrate/sulfonate/bicarbonate transport system substrate-binding protein